MKRFLFILSFISFHFVKAQGTIEMEDKVVNYNLPVDTSLQRILRQSVDYQKLSANDQQVAYYLNYARRNPKIFLDKAINVFVAAHPEVKSSYIGSLQATFKSLAPLNIIMPSAPISTLSMAHAKDMQAQKSISHTSSNGTSFQQRMQGVLKVCGGECIHASMRYTPLEAILALLFDFNVPDLGHRKTLLDTKFTKAGFGSAVKADQFSVLVMDFSCQ